MQKTAGRLPPISVLLKRDWIWSLSWRTSELGAAEASGRWMNSTACFPSQLNRGCINHCHVTLEAMNLAALFCQSATLVGCNELPSVKSGPLLPSKGASADKCLLHWRKAYPVGGRPSLSEWKAALDPMHIQGSISVNLFVLHIQHVMHDLLRF